MVPNAHQFAGGGRLRQLLGVAGDEARVYVAGPEVRRVQDQLMVSDRCRHLQRSKQCMPPVAVSRDCRSSASLQVNAAQPALNPCMCKLSRGGCIVT